MLCRNLKTLVAIWSAIVVVSCNRAAAPVDPVPPHDSFVIASKVLGENRGINVYLPPGYEQSDGSYPVVYMPDGGVKEDFPHIANTLADLIKEGKIPPVLLVGVENTDRRRDLTPASTTPYDRDFGPSGDGATAFRALIRDELMPEVAARYRTASGRTIVGESAAGLFVVDTFFREPALFDNYVAMDPALWWDSQDLVKQASARLSGMDLEGKSLWFAGSAAKDIQPQTRNLEGVLKEFAPSALRWTYRDSPTEEHSTIFRSTKEEAFLWTLGETSPR
ncbi:alpha/beta hydrolase [bacterium]|nr:alpha/beta hydrolase [bacterium]